MAQERNEMNASHSETDDDPREIERTRVEMSETIGEIQDRLRPDHLLQQAKDGVREAATGKVKNIMNSASETAYDAAQRARGVRQPPGVVRQGTSHPHRDHGRRGRVVDAARPRPQQLGAVVRRVRHVVGSRRVRDSMEPSLRDRVGDVASTARETVGEYASTARQAVGSDTRRSARETVGEYASSARETVNEYAQSAAVGGAEASRRVRTRGQQRDDDASTTGCTRIRSRPAPLRWRSARPSASRCRATEYEDRAMGETRDQALAKAQDVANNLRQNVERQGRDLCRERGRREPDRARGAPQPPMGHA